MTSCDVSRPKRPQPSPSPRARSRRRLHERWSELLYSQPLVGPLRFAPSGVQWQLQRRSHGHDPCAELPTIRATWVFFFFFERECIRTILSGLPGSSFIEHLKIGRLTPLTGQHEANISILQYFYVPSNATAPVSPSKCGCTEVMSLAAYPIPSMTIAISPRMSQ